MEYTIYYAKGGYFVNNACYIKVCVCREGGGLIEIFNYPSV